MWGLHSEDQVSGKCQHQPEAADRQQEGPSLPKGVELGQDVHAAQRLGPGQGVQDRSKAEQAAESWDAVGTIKIRV